MIKDIVTYQFGSFTDYTGTERFIIACALSQKVASGLTANWEHADDRFPIYRAINIGFAVYNPEDAFSIEEGKRYAYTKAVRNNPSLFVAEGDLINDEITKALLTQAIKKFKPETIITNYKGKAAVYKTIAKSKEHFEKLSIDKKSIVKKLLKSNITQDDIDKCKPFLNEAMAN